MKDYLHITMLVAIKQCRLQEISDVTRTENVVEWAKAIDDDYAKLFVGKIWPDVAKYPTTSTKRKQDTENVVELTKDDLKPVADNAKASRKDATPADAEKRSGGLPLSQN